MHSLLLLIPIAIVSSQTPLTCMVCGCTRYGTYFITNMKLPPCLIGIFHLPNLNPISHNVLIPWVPQGGLESTPPMENPFRTTSLLLFYTQSNIHVSGPIMQKGRSLASKLWNWQPIKNRTRRLEILKIRKI